MANYYKRKRISNLADLDLEEAKIKKKLRRIEQEWVEILDPQQLAIGFLTRFITGRLRRKKEKNTAEATIKVKGASAVPEPKKSSGFRKALKVTGVAVLAAIVIKKILKRRTRTKVTVKAQ